MSVFRAFIRGFVSSFSLGWPTSASNLNVSAKKNILDDWSKISNDLEKAIKKFQHEQKNDK